MIFVIDSNVLLDYPQIVEDKNNQLIIATSVLKELDGLKKHVNNDIAFNARRAAVYISRNLNNINFISECEKWNMPVDDQLLKITKECDGILITNDVYLKVRATIENIKTKGYSNKDDYTGVEYWYIKTDENLYNKELDEVFTTGKIPYGIELCENQYLIVKDINNPYIDKHGETDYTIMGEFVCKNNKLLPIKERKICNQWIDCIIPRNAEQTCLFDAISNKDNTIIYAGGGFGRGKSFILNNYAIQELEKEHIKKIIYVPNNAFTENTMDLGALPGELLSKIEGQIGPLIDLVGIDKVQNMIAMEQLEIVPMGFIRGRSFTDSIVIVNESQNLTEDHIKLLIARCGDGTRIFFDGDIKQSDSQLFRNKNGLKLLLNLRKSPIYSKMFATVKLITTERSKTAQAAQYLDDIISGI
jgi:PhoH-like ATPase